MGAVLSYHFKDSKAFESEFRKLIKHDNVLADEHLIFQYIDSCAGLLFEEAQRIYINNKIKAINLLSVYNNKLFPGQKINASDGDLNMLITIAYNLLGTKAILPLAKPIHEHKMNGVCLYSGPMDHIYENYVKLNLAEIDSGIRLITNGNINPYYLQKQIMNWDIQDIPSNVDEFAHKLSISSEKERKLLYKAAVFYKAVTQFYNGQFYIYFLNKYNPTHTFYDGLLTVVSEKPFGQHELYDFSMVIENITSYIAEHLAKNNNCVPNIDRVLDSTSNQSTEEYN